MVKHLTKEVVFNGLAAVLAELAFAFLPLIVVTFAVVFKARSIGHALASPEWSFGSAIIAGQTLVKFVSGLTTAKKPSGPRVALAIASIFVVSVVPALTILAMIIISDEPVPVWLTRAQIGWFCVNVLMFTGLGTLGHIWAEEAVSSRLHQPHTDER
jgi:hypothetical protein